MALNLELTSSSEKAISFTGEYSDKDYIEETLVINYSIAGTFAYTVSVLDADSSNDQTSVSDSNPGTLTVALRILKSFFTLGTSEFAGTVSLQIDDSNSSDTGDFYIDFKFIVTNSGVFVPDESFALNTNGIAVSTELVRGSDVETVARIAYPIVETVGGEGPFEFTWSAEDFDHFLIESVEKLDEANPTVNFLLDVANDIPEDLFNPRGGKWTQTGIFNVSVRDTSNGDISTGEVSWSYTVNVQEENKGDSIVRNSRTIPSRFRVRNPLNSFWYDLCFYEMYIFDKEYKQWIRLFPNKVLVRDGGNNDWLEAGCVTDPTYDDPCASLGSDSNCNGASQDPFAGSGDGNGSGGEEYDPITGYPQGYDLPDSSIGGFGVKIAPKATGYDTPAGYLIQRPGLQSEESYDPTGLSPDEGAHGKFLSPNLNGASAFSRGAAVTETVYELPPQNGYYELLYAAYDAVSIDVYYVGQRIATTCGPVPELTRGLLTFNVNIAAGLGERRIMVRVRGAADVRWAYQVIGPKPAPVLQDFDNKDDDDYAKIQEFLYEESEMMQMQYIGTPMFPAPCHGTVGNFEQTFPWALSDRIENQNWFEYYHYVGENGGPMVLDYSTWVMSDYVEIWQNGVRIATSQDYHQAPGSINFYYKPRDGVQDIMVRVHTENKGMGQDLSTWYYTLYCPDAIGHRAKPWPCGPDVVYSMGHPATEDNFDIDNGVDRGAFKVFMRACTAPTVVKVFTRDGELITTANGEGDFDVEAFNFNIVSGSVHKDIYVRVETSIGHGWEYTVGCPVPLLDITLDEIEPDIEWSISDAIVQDSESHVELTISINKAQLIDRSIDWSTADATAKNLTDYCAANGTATVPAGDTSVVIQVQLAPCGDVPPPDPVPEPDVTPDYFFKPILATTVPNTALKSSRLSIMESSDGMKGVLSGGSSTLRDNRWGLQSPFLGGTQVIVNALKAVKPASVSKVLMVSWTDLWYTFRSDTNDGLHYGKSFDAINADVFPGAAVTKISGLEIANAGNDNQAYFEQFDFIYFWGHTALNESSHTTLPPNTFLVNLRKAFESGIPFMYFDPSTGNNYEGRSYICTELVLEPWGIERSGGTIQDVMTAEDNIATFGPHPVWDGITGRIIREGLNSGGNGTTYWPKTDRSLVDRAGKSGKWWQVLN